MFLCKTLAKSNISVMHWYFTIIFLLAFLLTATRNYLSLRASFQNVKTFSVDQSLASSYFFHIYVDQHITWIIMPLTGQDFLYIMPLTTGLLTVSEWKKKNCEQIWWCHFAKGCKSWPGTLGDKTALVWCCCFACKKWHIQKKLKYQNINLKFKLS